MPKTPLRALRVSDELWKGAQSRARECGETVSEVVRRALSDYVRDGSGPATLGEPATVGVAGSVEPVLAMQPDSRFLLALGMVMQRHGLDARQADAYLRRLAADAGTDLETAVATFLQERDDARDEVPTPT